MRLALAVALSAASSLVVGIAAADESVPSHITGSVEAGYWSGTRDLTDTHNLAVLRLNVRGDAQLGSHASLHVEGRTWNQDAFRGAQNTKGELRALWLGIQPKDWFELKLGTQYVTWGRADGLNPTDLINPRDLTRLVAEESDQKLGTWLFEASFYFKSWSVKVLWPWWFEPSVTPLPPLGGGLTLTQQLPDKRYLQGALKLETSGGVVDASISYFDGYDHNPDLTMSLTAATLFYPRIRVIGLDAAKNIGQFGLRGEASYTFQESSVASPFPRRQDVVYIVIGVDRTFFEYLNVNVQYLGRYLTGFSDPASISDPTVRAFALQRAVFIEQQAQVQNGMSLRISYKWFHETLETEIRGVTWFTGDYLVSPRATYAVNDNIKISVGGDLYGGPANSIFGFLKNNSLGFAEVKYGF